MEINELNKVVNDLRARLDEKSRSVEDKSRYIEELANSLANIQAHQIDSYNRIKTNVDKERSQKL